MGIGAKEGGRQWVEGRRNVGVGAETKEYNLDKELAEGHRTAE